MFIRLGGGAMHQNIKENQKAPGSIPFYKFLMRFLVIVGENRQRTGNEKKEK
jgi:hypothetical protein